MAGALEALGIDYLIEDAPALGVADLLARALQDSALLSPESHPGSISTTRSSMTAEAIPSCWLEACRACCAETADPDPESVHRAIERTREWYWSDPERHRLGRLDLAAAGRRVVQIALDELGVNSLDLARRVH